MKLYKCAEKCAKTGSLMDISLLKLCACSAGIIAGMFVPRKNKASVLAFSSVIFSVTFFPLMFKVVKAIAGGEK